MVFLKKEQDNPSIGLLLCQEQERPRGRVFAQGYEQAHRRQRLSDHQQPAGRTGTPTAVRGGYPEADQERKRVMAS